MNIIEKLGITKGPWKLKYINNRIPDVFSSNGKPVDSILSVGITTAEKNVRLMSTAPEMLEALIKAYKKIAAAESWHNLDFCTSEWLIPIIEKAASATWKEIKEML